MPSRPHPEPKAPERPEVLRPTRPGLVQAYIREKIESAVEVEIARAGLPCGESYRDPLFNASSPRYGRPP